jgi:zinc protease
MCALPACRGAISFGRSASDLANPPPAGAPADALALPAISERVLTNGLTVLAAEYHEVPLVIFHLLMQGGAAYDPPGKGGVAELTADLLREGTERLTAEELAREIEFLGGSLDADAGVDFSSISGEFLSKDLDRGLELFTEVARHPAFRPEDVRRTRGLALAEIIAARENASSIADRCFQSYLYGAHPYGHPSEGTEQTVGTIGVEDVRSFYRQHFGPARAVLVVIGDAPAAALLSKAERAFGDWRPAAAAAMAIPAPVRVAGRKILLVDKPDATQTHIRVGNVAIARSDPTFVPAVVTSTILGGGFGSRLIDQLRVRRSLTYGAWSFFAARRVPGDFRVGTFTKVATTGEALTVALDVLASFAREGATAVELERAQSLLTGQYPLQLETPGALAGRLAELEAYGLPRADIETFPAQVLAVRAEDVRRVAGRYVTPADAAIVVVGPATTLAPQLAKLGTVDRSTPEACSAVEPSRARR